MDITVRHASTGDATLVAHLIHQLLEELGDKELDVAPYAITAQKLMDEGEVQALIAYHGDTPVGLIALNESASVYAGGKFGTITELYVAPDYRSAGVAPKLIAAAQDLARLKGWLRFEVGAPDQPRWKRTFEFYIKEGFEEVGPRLRKVF